MNRRLTALSLSIVAALAVSACGGGDSSSRTRNGVLIGNEGSGVQVDCYGSEGERASARAAALDYWNSKIAGLQVDLSMAEAIEILPVLAVASPPRDEYASDDDYNAEVARLQATYEQDKAKEQLDIKSKADLIAGLNSSITAAQAARDAEVAKIDALSLCVGDPGMGAGGDLTSAPTGPTPCATAAAADLVMSSDPYKLTVRICDEATKLSVQNYDIMYNTLSAGEVLLEPGTARTHVVDVAVSDSAARNYKVVVCSATGYINTALISVQGQNVTTTYQDDSAEPIVIDFCGGQAPTGGGDAAPSDGGVGAAGAPSNSLPVDDNGNLTEEAVTALNAACDGRVTFDVQELIFTDNNLTANEPLLANIKIDCQVATPQLVRVEYLPKAYKTGASGDNPDDLRYFSNGEDGTSMVGDVRFDLPEGQWNMKAVVRLIFKTGDDTFQAVDFASGEKVLDVGPEFVEPNPCTSNSFALSPVVDKVKKLTSTCDHIKYGLTAVSSDFVISADQEYDQSSFPVPHKVGRGRLIHYVEGKGSVMDGSFQLISCDDDCTSDTLDSTVSLTRTGDGVEFTAEDRCKSINEGYGTYAVAAPYIEIQPDLLTRQIATARKSLVYLSRGNSGGSSGNSRILTGADWFWVVSTCTVDGEVPKDVSTIVDAKQWLVKLSNPSGTPAPESIDTTSTETPSVPAVPVASVARVEALILSPGSSSIAVGPSDVAALLEQLKMTDAVVAIGFDDAPLITMSYLTPRKLDVPSDAKVLRVMVAPAGGEPTVLEYPVSQPVVVDGSTGAVAASATNDDGGFPLWLIALLIVLVILVVMIMSRAKNRRQSDSGSVS